MRGGGNVLIIALSSIQASHACRIESILLTFGVSAGDSVIMSQEYFPAWSAVQHNSSP